MPRWRPLTGESRQRARKAAAAPVLGQAPPTFSSPSTGTRTSSSTSGWLNKLFAAGVVLIIVSLGIRIGNVRRAERRWAALTARAPPREALEKSLSADLDRSVGWDWEWMSDVVALHAGETTIEVARYEALRSIARGNISVAAVVRLLSRTPHGSFADIQRLAAEITRPITSSGSGGDDSEVEEPEPLPPPSGLHPLLLASSSRRDAAAARAAASLLYEPAAAAAPLESLVDLPLTVDGFSVSLVDAHCRRKPYKVVILGMASYCDCLRWCASDARCARFATQLTGAFACALYEDDDDDEAVEGPPGGEQSPCTASDVAANEMFAIGRKLLLPSHADDSQQLSSRRQLLEYKRDETFQASEGKVEGDDAEYYYLDDDADAKDDAVLRHTTTTCSVSAIAAHYATSEGGLGGAVLSTGHGMQEWTARTQTSWALFIVYSRNVQIVEQTIRALRRASTILSAHIVLVDNSGPGQRGLHRLNATSTQRRVLQDSELYAFFEAVNPSKLHAVPQLLKKYAGTAGHAALLGALEAKYGRVPTLDGGSSYTAPDAPLTHSALAAFFERHNPVMLPKVPHLYDTYVATRRSAALLAKLRAKYDATPGESSINRRLRGLVTEVIRLPHRRPVADVQNTIASFAHSRGLEFFFQVQANNFVIRCADQDDLGLAVLRTIRRVSTTSPHWGVLFFGGVGFAAYRMQAAAQVPWDSGIFDLGADCDTLERYERAGWKRHKVKLCPKRDGATQFRAQTLIDVDAERATWKEQQRALYHSNNETRAFPKSAWMHETNATKLSTVAEQAASKIYEFDKWFEEENYPMNPLTVSNLCFVPKDECKLAWPWCPKCPPEIPDCTFKHSDPKQLNIVRRAVEEAIAARNRERRLERSVAIRPDPPLIRRREQRGRVSEDFFDEDEEERSEFMRVLDVECTLPYQTFTIGFHGHCVCEQICLKDPHCTAFTHRLIDTKACLLYNSSSSRHCSRTQRGGIALTSLRIRADDAPPRASISPRPSLRGEATTPPPKRGDDESEVEDGGVAPCGGGSPNATSLREWMRPDQGAWAVFMVHEYEGTLPILDQALRAWWRASALMGANLIVVDNSKDQAAVQFLDRSLVRDVIPTPNVLSYTGAASFVTRLAARMELSFYFSVTPNHYVIRCNKHIDLATSALVRISELTAISPNWGAIFFAYQKFAVYRTQALVQAPWDPSAPEFGGDCDMLYRMELSGWTRHRSKLCGRVSLKGEGKRFVRTLFKVQRVLNITDSYSWLKTLRVLQHEKMVRVADDSFDDDMLWRVSGMSEEHNAEEYQSMYRDSRFGMLWMRKKWAVRDMCTWVDRKIRHSLDHSGRCTMPWPLCPACLGGGSGSSSGDACFAKVADRNHLTHAIERADGMAALSSEWWDSSQLYVLEPLQRLLFQKGVENVLKMDGEALRNSVIVELSNLNPWLSLSHLQSRTLPELKLLAVSASEEFARHRMSKDAV